MSALVIGDDTRSFLSVIRSIASAGMDVDVVTFDNASPALRSKYIQNIYNLNHQSIDIDEWQKSVTDILKNKHYDIVIPCDERAIFPLINSYSEENTHLLIHNEALTRELFDKSVIRNIATQCNIPTAYGGIRELRNLSYMELSGELGDRFVVKPLQSYADKNLQKRNDVHVITNEYDYLSIKDKYYEPVLVESFFSGRGCGISVLSFNGYIVRAFAHDREAEPLAGGGSSYRKSVALDPDMLHACKKYCHYLSYTGVAMFEFRKNHSTGEWIFIEVNSRYWGSLPLAIFSGVDFPKDHVSQALGESMLADYSYETGKYARSFSKDLYSLKAEYEQIVGSAGRVSALLHVMKRLGSYYRILTGTEKIDTLEFSDIGPFLAELDQMLSSYSRYSLWSCFRRKRQANSILERLRNHEFSEIVFVCYGNIMRSPFAEQYLNKLLATNKTTSIDVRSFGFHTEEGRCCPEIAVDAVKKYDVDLATHRSKWIKQSDVKENSQLIIVFDDKNEDMIKRYYQNVTYISLTEFLPAEYDDIKTIYDPYGKTDEEVEKCYAMISAGVDELSGYLK